MRSQQLHPSLQLVSSLSEYLLRRGEGSSIKDSAGSGNGWIKRIVESDIRSYLIFQERSYASFLSSLAWNLSHSFYLYSKDIEGKFFRNPFACVLTINFIIFFSLADIGVIGNEMDYYGCISKLFLNQELVSLSLWDSELWRKWKVIVLGISLALWCFIRCIALNWQNSTHILGMSEINDISIFCISRPPIFQVDWLLVILSVFILCPDPIIAVLSAECVCLQWWVASGCADFVVVLGSGVLCCWVGESQLHVVYSSSSFPKTLHETCFMDILPWSQHSFN